MSRKHQWLASTVAACLWTGSSHAAPVDAAIIFAIDISASVGPTEAIAQRDGHAAALRAPEVIRAIQQGSIGCIAINYFEFSNTGYPMPILPWTRICDSHDADYAARVIEKEGSNGLKYMERKDLGRTSLSYAITYGAWMLERFPDSAAQRIIDVSANGENNDGIPVVLARNRAVDNGITVNAIMVEIDTLWDVPPGYFEAYLRHSVIGGDNAFVMPGAKLAQYPAALRRKLVREIAGVSSMRRN